MPTLDRVDGARELLDVSDMVGSGIVGRVTVTRGTLWVSVVCRGAGTINLSYEPLGQFEVPCTSDGTPHTLNKIELYQSYELSVTVTDDAGDNRWSVLIQE
ncbi:hypothetical protein [Micromonospora sp. NPDC005189]|uniref:hypothetical protein n=1 Tax=unclassified Micromonospora TaxID=2617518 RepID=UPI0033A7F608